MSDHIYKKIELVGSSPKSIEEAVSNALSRARKTIRNMRWFEVTETRGYIEDGKVNHWQVETASWDFMLTKYKNTFNPVIICWLRVTESSLHLAPSTA